MTITIDIDTTSLAPTGMRFVGDSRRIADLANPDIASRATASGDLSGPWSTVVLVPRIPADGEFAGLTDEMLQIDLGGALADLLADVQAALPLLADRGGHVILVLPAESAMGKVGSAMSGAFCGAALSLARTLAIELAREHISVNTVLHGELTTKVRDGLVAQLTALSGSDGATGQEIYVTAGTDLGRLHP